ncbi:MAG: ABC transporter permease [Bdellovibrionales bacterium]|nr:ABC transporter permease [Bdellovibrionales bacterium]
MFNYIIRRLLVTLPVILGVCTLTFLLIHFVPGDPIDIMLGDQASTVDKEALRSQLGLNQPLLVQYKNFLWQISHLDLGQSLHSKSSVTSILSERIPATVELTVAAMFFAILFGIPLGIIAAVKQYSTVDNSILVTSLFGISLPGFFLGPMLIWIFAILLPLFPVSERGGIENLVLPALSLALPLGAIILRMTRTQMLEEIKQDYIRVARSKGLSDFPVYFKHALRNALIPVITIIGLQVGALLTGTVITETIFDWPGIGSLLLQAIQQRDYPIVQGCVLLIALTYVIVNLFTDISYAIVNPKVRLS